MNDRLPDLSILMNGVVAARLRISPSGETSLRYDDDYMDAPSSVPLSLSLPFSDDAHSDDAVQRWARSLLPDNPNTLSRWYGRDDVRQRNPFGLLSTQIGFDCAGAVQFCPVGEESRLADRASGVTLLAPSEVIREIDAIVGDPDAWTPDDIEPYFSLGGFQSKIALHRVGDRWARPFGSTPTTDILKPRSHTGRFVAVAEHLCLTAARELGLNAAESALEEHGANVVLVVKRYDRAFDGARWRRIHQEDMCQALGFDGSRKYEHTGGPGMTEIGDLIRTHSSRPRQDVSGFADALIYAWLVVNRDAHARNYSLVHAPGRTELAPLYDINSSLMFRKRKIGDANMAMRYGSTFTAYSAGSRQALPDMAIRLRLPAQELIDRADQMASLLPDAMRRSLAGLPEELQAASETQQFVTNIDRRATECLKSINAAREHARQPRGLGEGVQGSRVVG